VSDEEKSKFLRLKTAEFHGRVLRQAIKETMLLADFLGTLPRSDKLVQEIVRLDSELEAGLTDEQIVEWDARRQEVLRTARRRVC
jgi:hypothetical protein